MSMVGKTIKEVTNHGNGLVLKFEDGSSTSLYPDMDSGWVSIQQIHSPSLSAMMEKIINSPYRKE